MLDDATDKSPSVIEPKAESSDGLQLPPPLVLHVFMPREYSARRLFEFLDELHESVVNWFEKNAVGGTGAAELSTFGRFSFVG